MECAELQSVVLVPPFSWFCCLCCLFLFITALVIPKITIVTIAQQLVLVPVVGAIPHAPGFTVRQDTCAASSIHCRPSGVCFVAAVIVICSSVRIRRLRPVDGEMATVASTKTSFRPGGQGDGGRRGREKSSRKFHAGYGSCMALVFVLSCV